MFQAVLVVADKVTEQTVIPVSVPMSDEAARAEVDRIKTNWWLRRHADALDGWYEVRTAK